MKNSLWEKQFIILKEFFYFLETVLNFYKKVFLDLVYSFAYNNFKTVSS